METTEGEGKARAARRVPGMFKRGSTWWLKFYEHGKRRRVTLDTTNETEARRRAALIRGRLATGAVVGPRPDRVVWEEGVNDLRTHYRATGSRDPAEFQRRLKPLDAFFRGRRLAAIGQPEINAYTVQRTERGVSPSSVRRELGTVVTMLRLAYKNSKVSRMPAFSLPPEGDARTGFVEEPDFLAIRKHLPADLQVAVTLAYRLSWRKQEVLNLQRRHVDLKTGEIRLDASMTKGRRGRVAHLTSELRSLLAEQLARVDVMQRKLGRVTPWLFPNLRGTEAARPGSRLPILGERIQSFRKCWSTACRKAGKPGLLVHDLRRSGIRNMVRAGVPDSVAMAISGHKTRSIFMRYDITSDADLREAARRVEGHAMGHNTGHTG